ncbi:MAG TPA: histone deacetylase [Verrucomicrobiales bacterium]|nr:histone deacetylase [Verrucomicrobiales bacterium]
MKIITDPRCTEYQSPGHPERPSRISGTVAALRRQTSLPIDWLSPGAVGPGQLERAHDACLLQRVQDSEGDLDADTPRHPGIHDHALRSVGGALQALDLACKGESAISLLRPPGHHATRDTAMGFCYYNSIAVAALEARARGLARVAVLDFDVHHGNGTEEILLNQPGTAFFSIHQSPCYPGTGLSDRGPNCFNYPVRPHVPRLEYRQVLQRALEDLARFRPEVVGVSAGFDGYARDPLAQGTLEAEDFLWLGSEFRRLGIPVFHVLEGGYSDDLPELVLAYLTGLSGRGQPT